MNNIVSLPAAPSTVFAAFVMEGILETEFYDAIELVDGGAHEIVSAVMAYVPVIEALSQAALAAGAEPAGVIEYDVCNPFGEWFMTELLDNGTMPTRQQVVTCLTQAVTDFYVRHQPAAARVISAAVRGAAITLQESAHSAQALLPV